MQEYFQTVTDTDFAVDAATVLASYMAPSLYGPVIDSFAPVDVPDEAYGIAQVVAAEAFLSGGTKTLVQYGGAIYTLDTAAERFGVKQSIEGIAGGAN